MKKIEKTLAVEKLESNLLLLSGFRQVKMERDAYSERETESLRMIPSFYLQYPVYMHSYDLGLAWAAQLEAAMKGKYGSVLSPKAWKEIGEVFSLGKMLDWQDQIKLLTSKREEVTRIVGLLKGTAADAEQGRRELKASSGKYFNTKAWAQEVQNLLAVITAPHHAA